MITNLTIKDIQDQLKQKKFTAVQLVDFLIAKIEKEDPAINSFVYKSYDLAREQAKKVDEMIAAGQDLPALAGIPCAIKDNILIDGINCSAGSNILKDYVASYDATVIQKLKEQGAIILGKLNLDEFAMGSSGEYSAFGPTKNPRDLERVPGGSSSGPAAAVAAGFCQFSLGSDTGGSIRQPASFCGLVGLKPTYGAVSRYGLISLASSLDQIGPIAKNVDDARIVYQAIIGKDSKDSTCIGEDNKGEVDIKKIKIGIPKEYFVSGIDPEVEKTIKATIDKLKEKGADVVEISLPYNKYALACYQILLPAEASANLARYDNIRYGNKELHSGDFRESLEEIYRYARQQGFGPEVRRRIMLGTYALSAGYYDAYYLRAQKVRTLIGNEFRQAFKYVDFIITPTCPTLPFKLGERKDDPVTMYLSDLFTTPANIAGVCAISIPCAKQGLPVGLQIIGNYFQEDKLFKIAKIFEEIK